MKFINMPIFILSLCIGIFISYITLPKRTVIFVYPTPDNIGELQYKDDSDACFGYSSHVVDCPTDTDKIREYPIQKHTIKKD
jgi:hypothetical protein